MIRFHKLVKRAAELRHGSAFSAGYDIPALEWVRIPAGKTVLVRTGIGWKVTGWHLGAIYGQVAPRSGIDTKKYLSVRAGVIDPDYEGEIMVALHNRSTEDQVVERGEYIAQIIIKLQLNVDLFNNQQIEGVSQSYRVRGAAGFGSTDNEQ